MQSMIGEFQHLAVRLSNSRACLANVMSDNDPEKIKKAIPKSLGDIESAYNSVIYLMNKLCQDQNNTIGT